MEATLTKIKGIIELSYAGKQTPSAALRTIEKIIEDYEENDGEEEDYDDDDQDDDEGGLLDFALDMLPDDD